MVGGWVTVGASSDFGISREDPQQTVEILNSPLAKGGVRGLEFGREGKLLAALGRRRNGSGVGLDKRSPHRKSDDVGGAYQRRQGGRLCADGRRLLSAGSDRTVRVWDLMTPVQPKLLKVLDVGDVVFAATFVDDGTTVAIGGNWKGLFCTRTLSSGTRSWTTPRSVSVSSRGRSHDGHGVWRRLRRTCDTDHASFRLSDGIAQDRYSAARISEAVSPSGTWSVIAHYGQFGRKTFCLVDNLRSETAGIAVPFCEEAENFTFCRMTLLGGDGRRCFLKVWRLDSGSPPRLVAARGRRLADTHDGI